MRRKYTRAFTLIELLAAMALGTLLMLAAMDVLRSLRPSAPPPDKSVSPDILRLLRWDLVNARRFQSNSDGVTLWGLDSLDPTDMHPTLRPTMVKYRVAMFAGQFSLLRLQQPLGASMGQTASWQLVCSDIANFSIAPLPDPTSDGRDDQPFDRNAGHPLPRSVELRLTRGDGNPMQTMICLR